LIVGLLVPLVGLLIAINMIGALVFVHASNGIFVGDGGYELVLVIAALGVIFAGLGAGSYAVDRLFSPASQRDAVAA